MWMFYSSNIARGCCNCCTRCPVEASLAFRNLKAKVKEIIVSCNYFCSHVAEGKTWTFPFSVSAQRHLPGPGGNRSHSPTNIYNSGCTEITAPATILTCVGIMLPSPWSQTGSLVLGILWVYVGLWASESKGLGSDTHIDFISHPSLKNPFIPWSIKNTILVLYYG